jgi:hypothetical protein
MGKAEWEWQLILEGLTHIKTNGGRLQDKAALDSLLQRKGFTLTQWKGQDSGSYYIDQNSAVIE